MHVAYSLRHDAIPKNMFTRQYSNKIYISGHRNIPQADLVQPSNVSVITGVAIQEGSSKENDRIIFSLRKDTRRVKYRINVLVNDELRYFDTVKRQKFRGAMIYVNDWKEGQSEIYVSLEKSRIGLRIRESYANEITKMLNFEESYGLLDVMVSVPPEYLIVSIVFVSIGHLGHACIDAHAM